MKFVGCSGYLGKKYLFYSNKKKIPVPDVGSYRFTVYLIFTEKHIRTLTY